MVDGPGTTREQLALTVHGPDGVLDLLVPATASGRDLAAEYAAQTGLDSIPLLFTASGSPLRPDLTLAQAGLTHGSLLVATTGVPRGRPTRGSGAAAAPTPSGAGAGLWLVVASGCALLAAWLAVRSADAHTVDLTATVLTVTAGLAVLPWGPAAARRALVAPVFAGAAAAALAAASYDGAGPLVLGLAGLAAAVLAAVARAVGDGADEGLLVWVVTGVALFVVAGGAALLRLPEAAVWSVLAVLAMLSARLAPALAVDVPDQLLVDLERLAVTAWSARERPRGRRQRLVVPERWVAQLAAEAARAVAAASTAVAAVTLVSTAMLVDRVTLEIDRIGAWVLVACVGAALLLSARSYRLPMARGALRVAGLGSLAVLAVGTREEWTGRGLAVVAGATSVAAAVLVVVAVAAGRGWRSAWWSRRAEVVEALCGAVAVAMVLVASGLFRRLWEIASAMFSSSLTG